MSSNAVQTATQNIVFTTAQIRRQISVTYFHSRTTVDIRFNFFTRPNPTNNTIVDPPRPDPKVKLNWDRLWNFFCNFLFIAKIYNNKRKISRYLRIKWHILKLTIKVSFTLMRDYKSFIKIKSVFSCFVTVTISLNILYTTLALSKQSRTEYWLEVFDNEPQQTRQ